MALKLLIGRKENSFHGEFPNGYHMISEYTIDKKGNQITIKLSSFVDEEARRYIDSIPIQDPNNMLVPIHLDPIDDMPNHIHPNPMLSNYIFEKHYNFDFSDLPEDSSLSFESKLYILLKSKIDTFKNAIDC